MQSVIVQGGQACAVAVNTGDTVRVVNTHGTQVVDFWAVRADRPEIAMSMQHSRIRWRNLRPRSGDHPRPNSLGIFAGNGPTELIRRLA